MTKPKNETERKQVGVHIDTKLWRKFRASAIEQGVQTGHLMEQLIEAYLNGNLQPEKGGESMRRTKTPGKG